MLDINRMTEEEILGHALGAIPDYLSSLGRCGRFSAEECLRRCIGRVKDLYKRSIPPYSPASRVTLTGAQVAELTRLCLRLDAPLRERIASVQDRHTKEKAVFQINSATALAIIPAAVREIGLDPKVTTQKYRARVDVTLPRDGRLRFYIRYRDLLKEGAVDSVVRAVADLRDILENPGGRP